MEAFLDANDLWDAIEQDYNIPTLPANPTLAQIKNQKEMKQRKSKAKASLFAAVSPTIFNRIMTLKTAKEIWDFLKQEYEGNERVKGMQVMNLIRDFEMQRMNESETIQQYADRLLAIANNVRLLGTDFPDSRIVQKILVTLPEKYEAAISSLEISKDMSSITLAEVLNALQAQEQRRLMRQEGSVVDGAFQAKTHNNNGWKNKKKMQGYNNKNAGSTYAGSTNNKYNNQNNKNNQVFPPCPNCKKTNHPHNRCWWRPDARCHKCGQLGHMEKICKSQQQQGEAKVVEDLPKEEMLFAVSCFAANSSTESWLIDSGCTNHMTHDRELFRELDKIVVSKVRIGNGAYIAVKGKGTVAIEGLTGLKLIFDVLYVPEINQNLLSVPQLLEKGYKVLFEDKNCMIKDSEGREVFKVQMAGKSFTLDLMKDELAAVHEEDTTTMLWHKRLGHFHHGPLIFMKKHNLAHGLPELEKEPPTCSACRYGKLTRLSFPKNKVWKATQKLQLIHTDVGGPMSTPSLNGSKYYIAFIDDYTRMCWIYFMKFKSEVADIFVKFKAWAETQSREKI
uniref:Retrovirus-related Pol polyprotein from transposon TNT 1-94 n=1 Tax=Cajanus cajan TaxID=3821 RepID=A0A151TAI7_CAJCA|nr:Retrovirus-related Pol polyprotein from transposon TNT 1-94 [Cajanus cajan]